MVSTYNSVNTAQKIKSLFIIPYSKLVMRLMFTTIYIYHISSAIVCHNLRTL